MSNRIPLGRIAVACLFGFLVVANDAAADVIVDSGVPTGFTSSVSSTQYTAQEFVLSQTYEITEISPFVRVGTNGATLRAQVSDMIGTGTTAGNVLFDTTFAATTTTGFTPITTSFVLGPGTYYLVLSPGTGTGFWRATATNTIGGRRFANSSTGGIDTTLPPASTWFQFTTSSFGLKISASPKSRNSRPGIVRIL